MTECQGNGKCYKKCDCECFEGEEDDDDEAPDRVCSCVHKEHFGFCPNDCQYACSLIECRNFEYCGAKSPKWLHEYNYKMCINCVIKMGPHENSKHIEECPVCFIEKEMNVLKCGHKICNKCWYIITDIGYNNIKGNFNPACPLCRNKNIWTSFAETTVADGDIQSI
jgi:hypothetical protein